jgi:2-dehydro-3-deoxygluconokinase
MAPLSFASIGECMIELSSREGGLWHMGFAGDTFNAAFYARAILPAEARVAYVTALGEDPFSKRMKDFIGASGVETERIRTVPGRRPGLYMITLENAERTFTYWRDASAARLLADDPGWLRSALAGADVLYFSGITLAILAPDRREQLLLALSERRDRGARIAFDPNFRAVLWPDRDEARAAMQAAYLTADVVLPTFDDEAMLFGDASPEATAERLAGFGVSEIVVKNGSKPCLVVAEGASTTLPAVAPEQTVDTTGAGDSFCGSYLAARHLGMTPAQAARLGHAVAAQVIGVPGALAKIDRDRVLQAAETNSGT